MAASSTDGPPRGPFTGLSVLRTYQRSWLRGDLAAGLTVGALLVTQCMAYAPLAGLPPQAAFLAVLVALPVYAVLGTSRHLLVGPDPGTAAVAGAGLAAVAAAGSTEYLEAASALALMVGVVLLAAGLLRFGFVADLLSRPALIGYLSGLGATLLVGQIPKLTGIPFESENLFERIADLVANADQVDGPTTAVGLSTLAVILAVKRLAPRLPAAVIGVVLATIVVAVLSLEDHGVTVVGELDVSLAGPAWPGIPLADWGALVPTALGVAVLGYADSYLTARGVSGRRGYALDADRELTGLGAANLAAGALRGMPVSSTGSGTAAADSAGGVTQLTLVIAAAFVLLGITAVPGLIEAIPTAALAAVVANAALSLLDPRGFRALGVESRAELGIAVATFLAVCAFDVLVGIIVSVGLGLVVALYRISRPHVAVLADAAELDGWVDPDTYEGTRFEPGLLIYRFDAPLFFVNARWYAERLRAAMEEQPGAERWIVLDFEGVGTVDTSATEVLAELCRELGAAGVERVAVARANTDALDRLRRAGLLAPAGSLHEYATINAAVRAYRSRSGD